MAINIKDPATDQLARALAASTGETITQAIQTSLRERLARVKSTERPDDLVTALDRISSRVAALPVLDTRSDDEIVGYDDRGVPR